MRLSRCSFTTTRGDAVNIAATSARPGWTRFPEFLVIRKAEPNGTATCAARVGKSRFCQFITTDALVGGRPRSTSGVGDDFGRIEMGCLPEQLAHAAAHVAKASAAQHLARGGLVPSPGAGDLDAQQLRARSWVAIRSASSHPAECATRTAPHPRARESRIFSTARRRPGRRVGRGSAIWSAYGAELAESGRSSAITLKPSDGAEPKQRKPADVLHSRSTPTSSRRRG